MTAKIWKKQNYLNRKKKKKRAKSYSESLEYIVRKCQIQFAKQNVKEQQKSM